MPKDESVRAELMRDFDEAIKYVTRTNMEAIADTRALASIIERLDDLAWDIQYATTTEDEWAAISASVKAEIDAGQTFPMFDENGKFILDDAAAPAPAKEDK